MRTASGSWRCVVYLDVPGRRLSSHTCKSASVKAMRGGTPSTTQPIAGPWLSPNVVKRKRVPKVLLDIGCRLFVPSVGRQQLGILDGGVFGHHADDVIARV